MKIIARDSQGTVIYELYPANMITIEVQDDGDDPICFIEIEPETLPDPHYLQTVNVWAAHDNVTTTSSMSAMCFGSTGGH